MGTKKTDIGVTYHDRKRVCWTVAFFALAILLALLGGCGDGLESPSSQPSSASMDVVGPGLSIDEYHFWDQEPDQVWTSVSLKDAAGDWVTGRTIDEFELTETLLGASGGAGPVTIDLSDPGSYYPFDGPSFWERSVTEQKLDIVFIVDTSGTMEEEMPDIRSELHDFVDRLQEEHVDFRLGIIGDEWMPEDTDTFPFHGVMEVNEIHDAIDDYYLTTCGEWWEPNIGYDSLMLATAEFDWRTDPDVRKIIIIITDTLPQSVYGNFWYLSSTAANRKAAEIALEGKGFEVFYSQPRDPAVVMEHPDMEYYTRPDTNPRAGCSQTDDGWDCGFATLGNPIAWPFDQKDIHIDPGRPIVDSRYYFAWHSSLQDMITDRQQERVRVTISTADPDASTTLDQSFEYVPSIEKTDLVLNLTDAHNNAVKEILIQRFAEIGDCSVKLQWEGLNTPIPGQVLFEDVPVGDWRLLVEPVYEDWGGYGYPILHYEGSQEISVPGGGMTMDWQLQAGYTDIELAKARGLLDDLKHWGVTDRPFAEFVAKAEAWLDGLEANGIDFTEMERIKRFYVALSGYVNASGYAEVEGRRMGEDFEQILLKFRDIIEKVRKLSDDTDTTWGLSMGEASIRLDLPSIVELTGAKITVDELKKYAEEELVPVVIDKIIEQIPAGNYKALLKQMVNGLILGHWDDWPELLDTMGELALDGAMDVARELAVDQITDALFEDLDVDVDPGAKELIKTVLTQFATDGFNGIEQALKDMETQLASLGSTEQALAAVDEIYDALGDRLAAGPVRDFVLPMTQLVVRAAIQSKDIDDDAVISAMAHYFTHQIIVKPKFGEPVAVQLDDALSKAQAFVPDANDLAYDRFLAMGEDFGDFRVPSSSDGMYDLNDASWKALARQEAIDDFTQVLSVVSDMVDGVVYPLFYGLCSAGYPTCALARDAREFTAVLDAVGLMTKVVELCMKTDDLTDLTNKLGPVNDRVLVE
jgi:hypothetical protein